MYESAKAYDFMIVSVAMDSNVEAARPWIEKASVDYVTLIDQNHLLSSLYNMVNVPQAVWIDEMGKIVRPVETGGSLDILREFDPQAGAFKPEAVARAARVKAKYTDAVKDWAAKGSASSFVFDSNKARSQLPKMTDNIALAHAKFQLGRYLYRNSRGDEAETLFAESRRLHPDSWNIFRETTERMETGIAAGDKFWEKVTSLGDKPYYSSIDMEGMPD